jgi:hypothetical protein
MRRVALPFALLIAAMLAGGTVLAPPARAVDQPVTLTLLAQSAWNSEAKPLQVKLRVSNPNPTALGGVAITLTIGFPARARSVYEETLTGDPTGQLFTTTFPEDGVIAAGSSRAFTISQPLDAVHGLESQSSLYPLRIEVRTNGELLAAMRTPMVYLTEPPRVPLDVASTFVLSDPMQVGPDGVFQPGPIEADIAPDGRLARIVAALDRADAPSVDLAVSPVLVAELVAMADGYRILRSDGVASVAPGDESSKDAADLLAGLRRVVQSPGIEVTAMPFGDASLPAILRAEFGDLAGLVRRGRDDVGSTLSVTPSTTVYRPPGSALDRPSFMALVDGGVATLLLDPGFIPTPRDLPYSPPSVGTILATHRSATAVLPDEGVAKLAAAYPDDPVLGAHAALGEMAARWLEFPNAAGRGVALFAADQPAAPPGLYPALVSLLVGSPWLHTAKVSAFVSQVPPTQTAPLPSRRYPSFGANYVARIRAARALLGQFRAAAGGADVEAVVARLADDLVKAESGTFVTAPSLGLAYITRVDGPGGVIARTYRQVTMPPNGRIFTLASGKGPLPFFVQNDSRFTLKLRVALDSPPSGVLRFDPSARALTLPPDAGLRIDPPFQVSAETTGRFRMNVRLTTPGGALVAHGEFVVRSTAYNRVALVVTIGAGLFLAVWWGRGVLRRRRS